MMKKLCFVLLVFMLFVSTSLASNTDQIYGACSFYVAKDFFELDASILGEVDGLKNKRLFAKENGDMIICGTMVQSDSPLYTNGGELFEYANEVVKNFDLSKNIITFKKLDTNTPCITVVCEEDPLAYEFVFTQNEIYAFILSSQDIYGLRSLTSQFNMTKVSD